MFRPALPLLLATHLTLTACVSKAPVPAYRGELFETETPFQFHSDLPALVLCDYGKRALLGQGYEVESSSPQTIKGSKYFQPQADYQIQLRITLVCLAGKEDSTIFANALQTRYELKAGNSTSLSVAAIGSVSLPWAADKSSLVKVGEETVSDPEFYRRLFVLIENLKD